MVALRPMRSKIYCDMIHIEVEKICQSIGR
jgi:hypothetical protein